MDASSGTIDPYRIRLTHWDGHYAGDYFWNTGKLRLFFRGSFIEYPLEQLIQKARRKVGARPEDGANGAQRAPQKDE